MLFKQRDKSLQVTCDITSTYLYVKGRVNGEEQQQQQCHLSVDVDDGTKQSPRSTLSIDMQHAQYLQEPNAAVAYNNQHTLHGHCILSI